MDGTFNAIRMAPGPADTPRPLTIADALRALQQWTDLAPSRAAKLRTALNVTARILAPGRDTAAAASMVTLDCTTLRALVRQPAAKFGMTRGRMTSMVSELRYVLRRHGLHEADLRAQPLSNPALQVLQAALPGHRGLALVDFLRFIEASAVAADTVGADTLQAYEARCAERTLCRDPAARGRQVAATWNWARQHLPEWGAAAALSRPKAAAHYALPLTSYPSSFQEDVTRHLSSLANGDVERLFMEDEVEEEGTLPRCQMPLRASTIRGRLQHIRAAATAHVADGGAPEALRSLEDLVNPPERARAIIGYHLRRRGGEVNSLTFRIADALRLIARDHCRLPAAHVAKLKVWAKRVKPPKQTGMTEKNRTRLLALMEPRSRAMLLNFPQELMRRAAKKLKPVEAARLAMNAVAMEILLICPLRLSNLSGIRLDQHLHRPDPRKPMITHLLISADEAKNKEPIQWPVPRESAKLIELYIKKHHHLLAQPGNMHLFPGRGMGPTTGMGTWLSNTVTKEIGVDYNVHLARHFAAWNFLRSNPGQYEVIRRVLGHKDIRTTITFYVGLEADASARHFDATVLRDRAATRHLAKQAYRSGRGSRSFGPGAHS